MLTRKILIGALAGVALLLPSCDKKQLTFERLETSDNKAWETCEPSSSQQGKPKYNMVAVFYTQTSSKQLVINATDFTAENGGTKYTALNFLETSGIDNKWYYSTTSDSCTIEATTGSSTSFTLHIGFEASNSLEGCSLRYKDTLLEMNKKVVVLK